MLVILILGMQISTLRTVFATENSILYKLQGFTSILCNQGRDKRMSLEAGNAKF